MERKELFEKLQSIIRDVVDNDEIIIRDETVATDVDGWDSLAQVLIIGELQNVFNVKFTSSEIAGFANVGELVTSIEAKLK